MTSQQETHYFVSVDIINSFFQNSYYYTNEGDNPYRYNNLNLFKFMPIKKNCIILNSDQVKEGYTKIKNKQFYKEIHGYNKLKTTNYVVWKVINLKINLFDFFNEFIYNNDFLTQIENNQLYILFQKIQTELPDFTTINYYRNMKMKQIEINKKIDQLLTQSDIELLFNYFDTKQNYDNYKIYDYLHNNSFKLTDKLEDPSIINKMNNYYIYSYKVNNNKISIRINHNLGFFITNYNIKLKLPINQLGFIDFFNRNLHYKSKQTNLYQNYLFFYIRNNYTNDNDDIKKLFHSSINSSNYKIMINLNQYNNNKFNNKKLCIDLLIKTTYLDKIMNSNLYISSYMIHLLFNTQSPIETYIMIKNKFIIREYNKKADKENGLINKPNNKNENEKDSDFNKINHYFNNSIKLFSHQKDNLIWMNSIEKKVQESTLNQTILINPNFDSIVIDNYHPRTNYVFLNEKCLLEKDKKKSLSINKIYNQQDIINTYNLNVQFTGGILADSVGLGKTLTCVSHIITSEFIYQKEQNKSPKNFQANNLIIVPNRIVEQWYLEIEKYLTKEEFKKLGIKKIMTLSDIKKIKESDLKENLIFIINASIFEFKSNYKKYLETPNKSNLNSSSSTFKFNVFKLKWNRIFVDEIHEICIDEINNRCKVINFIYEHNYNNYKRIDHLITIKNKNITSNMIQISKNINNLDANYRWGISGTPFKTPLINLSNILSFLADTNYKKYSNHFISNFNENQYHNFISNYIRSNTKINKNIKTEIKIPVFSEEITFLKQTNVERNIYLNSIRKDILTLFKLCTHILVSDELIQDDFNNKKILSLEEINDLMTKKLKIEIGSRNKEIKNCKEKILNFKTEISEQTKLSLILEDIYDYNNKESLYYLKKDNYKPLKHLMNNLTNYNKNNYDYYGYIHLFDVLQKQYSTLDKSILSSEIKNKVYHMVNTTIKEPELYRYRTDIDKCILIFLYFKRIIVLNYELMKKTAKQINSLEDKNVICQKQIDKFNITFIKETLKDPCIICYSDYEETPIMITKCQHIFCKECIDHLFLNTNTISCPYCRTELKKTDINMTKLNLIQDPKDSNCHHNNQSNKNDVQLDKNSYLDYNHKDFIHHLNREKRVNLYGTKLAHLVEYLGSIFKNNTCNRVIIFSQYDKLLKMTGNVLKDLEFKHLYLKGNVNVISKNIAKFKRDASYRIIMLSSEFSSSGNNLTEASHIVFLDVLNATSSETKNIESQAIGRAVRIGQKKSVVIKRFIMKNTIEEEYYNKNKYDIKEELMI